MPNKAQEIAFEPVVSAHLPILYGWLNEPHVREWWGEPEEELALLRSIIEDDDGTEGFIVSLDGAQVGYIQSWRPANFATAQWLAEAPWLADVPADTVGVDVFIGRPDLIAKGIGTAVVRQFCRRLFEAGAPRLIIDPDAANQRAVRAYEKAGFRPYGRHEADGETTLLMEMVALEMKDAGV